MSHHAFPWRDAFLAALRRYPVLQHACDTVGIDRSTVFRARQDDEAFAKDVAEAMEAGIDRAEGEAFLRGIDGVAEPVVYQGQFTPVYARDAQGQLVREDYDTGHKNEIGQPIIEKRLVQEIDAHGRPVWLTVNKKSDAMLALVLKGRRKAIYAERTEITGADGGPLATSDETTRAARLARLVDLAKLRKEAEDLG